MQIHKDDYVLVKDSNLKTPILMLVTGVKNSGVTVRFGGEIAAFDNSSFDVSYDEVVANLGATPAYGKVFGVDIEPYYGKIIHKAFSTPITLLVSLKDREKAALDKALKKYRSVAKEHGFLKHAKQIRVSIRPGLNSVAGTWSMNKEGEEKFTLYFPRSDTAEKKNSLPIDYVLFHEIGHHIWNRYFTEEEKASWIALYRKGVQLEEANTAKIARVRADLVKAGSIKEYQKSLEDDEEKALFREILKQVVKTFRIRKDEIDSLIKSGDNLANYWITTPVQRSGSKIIITEYARKNSQELWCECLAHLLTGQEMPENIQKKTANYLRKAIKRGPHGEMRALKVSG